MFSFNIPFFKKKEQKASASRTFINRIHVLSGKYVNWNPAFQIKLGDYGKLDRDTGEFYKIGNIFDDEKTKNASELKETTEPADKMLAICSPSIKEVPFTLDSNIEIAAGAEAAIQSQFQCSKDYGAILLMHKPILSRLEGDLDVLLQTDHYDHLRDMHLVTDIDTCPSYALYLSAKQEETVKLVFSMPSEAVNPDVKDGIGGKWYNEGTVGVYRSGSEPDQVYTPLYFSKSIGKKERGDGAEPGSDSLEKDTWLPSVMPWDALEEDGSETK